MANGQLRIIHCRGEEFWSQDGGSHRQNTKRSDPVNLAVLNIDGSGIVKELNINEPGYSLSASSTDGIHFHGDYNDSVSERGYQDQENVHFEHYNNHKRHCFVGDYNGGGYIGISYIFLDERDAS